MIRLFKKRCGMRNIEIITVSHNWIPGTSPSDAYAGKVH